MPKKTKHSITCMTDKELECMLSLFPKREMSESVKIALRDMHQKGLGPSAAAHLNGLHPNTMQNALKRVIKNHKAVIKVYGV